METALRLFTRKPPQGTIYVGVTQNSLTVSGSIRTTWWKDLPDSTEYTRWCGTKPTIRWRLP